MHVFLYRRIICRSYIKQISILHRKSFLIQYVVWIKRWYSNICGIELAMKYCLANMQCYTTVCDYFNLISASRAGSIYANTCTNIHSTIDAVFVRYVCIYMYKYKHICR